MDYKITKDDKQRVELLNLVAKKGLNELTIPQLETLEILVQRKDYTYSKKAAKSKSKLLAKINVALYEKAEGRQGI